MKKRFFGVARKESYLSDYDGQHLGAVAVYADKFILAKAHNSDKTNTGCEICRTKNGKPRSLFVMTDANQTITDIKFYHVCGAKM